MLQRKPHARVVLCVNLRCLFADLPLISHQPQLATHDLQTGLSVAIECKKLRGFLLEQFITHVCLSSDFTNMSGYLGGVDIGDDSTQFRRSTLKARNPEGRHKDDPRTQYGKHRWDLVKKGETKDKRKNDL
jgi:hypothetical protein